MGNRDVAEAWAYHDATKHSLSSIRNDPHFLDWDVMPRPFKVYTELEPIPLARDLTSSPRPALDALADDFSAQSSGGAAIDLGTLAHLLYFSAGVLKRRTYQMDETYFRAAACTGNLHHIDIYLTCMELDGLAAGVYHFSPHDFALRRLREGDHRGLLIEATAAEEHVAEAPVVLAFSSTYWRNAWKYRARAYRHAFWDSGTVLANLLAVASARRLPARVVLGFVDEQVNGLLGLDVEHEAALGLVALGRGAPPPPPLPEPPPLALETLPLSAREVQYPAIPATHRSGFLASSDEVRAWRVPLRSAAAPPADDAIALLPTPADAGREPIETVILRRGSTRHFAQKPITLAELSAVLRAATRGVPADFAAPRAQRATVYLIVNDVEGLEPGAYVLDRDRDALLLLRAGRFRREAGYLGLGQQIPADAAVDLFWLTDLTEVLGALGNRGYRAAQLEAAIGGGKTYLAAYALGLGASGLTFFDDDVTAFFSPHARGKSVMFLMAVGVPQRLRRSRAGG
ncbi:MAG: SagB family peptide dehydrogenase [Thermodesulfobacteriota bacterium]